jgi:hypothetical protein
LTDCAIELIARRQILPIEEHLMTGSAQGQVHPFSERAFLGWVAQEDLHDSLKGYASSAFTFAIERAENERQRES